MSRENYVFDDAEQHGKILPPENGYPVHLACYKPLIDSLLENDEYVEYIKKKYATKQKKSQEMAKLGCITFSTKGDVIEGAIYKSFCKDQKIECLNHEKAVLQRELERRGSPDYKPSEIPFEESYLSDKFNPYDFTKEREVPFVQRYETKILHKFIKILNKKMKKLMGE